MVRVAETFSMQINDSNRFFRAGRLHKSTNDQGLHLNLQLQNMRPTR